MDTISYWMAGSLQDPKTSVGHAKPISIDQALESTELSIRRADGQWVLLLQGFPREWHDTQEAAQQRAREWSHMEPTVEYATGPTWLVYGGDQYLFSSTSLGKAEGFVFGIRVGRHIEQIEVQDRQGKSGNS